jgi:hypothetical protein
MIASARYNYCVIWTVPFRSVKLCIIFSASLNSVLKLHGITIPGIYTRNSYGLLKHVIYACTIDPTSAIISANVAHLATCVTVSPTSGSTFAIQNNQIRKMCTT